MRFRRRSLVIASVTAVVFLSATAVHVFSAGGDPAVAVPSPSASSAAVCRRLHAALPAEVDGLARHPVVPSSDLTAGWGDPTVVLRCGVRVPRVLDPHAGAAYDPTADAAEVNGVTWLVQRLVHDQGYRFTTTDRRVYVEVTVPHGYAPEIDPLTDLAAAVTKTVPPAL